MTRAELLRQVGIALEEDIGAGDLTAQLVPADQTARATVLCKQDAVICGLPWFDACFKTIHEQIRIHWFVREGDFVSDGTVLCELEGPARGILTAERPALNFLQTLSSVATLTWRYVKAVEGTNAVILDTRKTLPGLRYSQKYAVRVGGGKNQRLALYDGILIKENHILAKGGVRRTLDAARQIAPENVSIQIEVETLEELSHAIDAGAKLILLDNFSLEEMRQAVAITQGRALLEVSGGVTLENVRKIAEIGIDRISIGRLTKNIHAVDLSLRFDEWHQG